MTARELLRSLSAADCSPRVDGQSVVFDRRPPDDLLPYVTLLKTGLRAAMTGRPWYALGVPGAKDKRACARGCGSGIDGTLSPDEEIPPHAFLLCVAGDARWDRIRPGMAEKLPDAFREPTALPKRPWTKRPDQSSRGAA